MRRLLILVIVPALGLALLVPDNSAAQGGKSKLVPPAVNPPNNTNKPPANMNRPPQPPTTEVLVRQYEQNGVTYGFYKQTTYVWTGTFWKPVDRGITKVLASNNPGMHQPNNQVVQPINPGLQQPINAGIQNQAPAEPAVEAQYTRYLAVKNETDERLTVYVYYRTWTDKGNWVWYPADPSNSERAIKLVLGPGQSEWVYDGNWSVHANKVRIWAEGSKSGLRLGDKDRDFYLVKKRDDDGYRYYYSSKVGSYVYKFTPPTNVVGE
ncbi:MAG: hypothetical protein K2R98_28015 [Gemmataceae bacterium]|nr:hypothetical protein [Gemmataceae bacterium]